MISKYAESRPDLSKMKANDQYNLTTTNPELVAEWDYGKNGLLLPTMVTPGAARKVWWHGTCGHEWQATVSHRVSGEGCPYCSNKKVLPHYNDLESQDPALAREWHPTKNGDLKPTMVAPFSQKKVWWLDCFGHEWVETVANRSQGKGCPICAKERKTSFPEQALLYYIRKFFPDALNGDSETVGMELDIYVPSKRIAIEYDGERWHRDDINVKREVKKTALCEAAGIALIRVREGQLDNSHITGLVVQRIDHSYSSLNKAISEVLCLLGVNDCGRIDTESDSSLILESFLSIRKENSLLLKAPELAKEWNYQRNGELQPIYVNIGSQRKVWWRGTCGHEWLASVANRNKGRGCPICKNSIIGNKAIKRSIKDDNTLQTLNSKLASEWHPTKNGRLTPKDVAPNSNKKVWWLGQCGHEWQAAINKRNAGSNCPICKNQIIGEKAKQRAADRSSLLSNNPSLVAEWDYDKNGTLGPNQVSLHSKQIVWWRGQCGHEWKQSVQDRVEGRKCPFCAGKQILVGFNDLYSQNPVIAKEWHPTKNGELKPTMVTTHSGKKVWWKCQLGHEWEAIISNRTKGIGCPYCSNKKVLPGFNDLSSQSPDLAREWHPTRNGGLKPSMVTPHSGKKVWWKCQYGHEWESIIDNRSKGSGCPICSLARRRKIEHT